jgi:hypothetical protein
MRWILDYLFNHSSELSSVFPSPCARTPDLSECSSASADSEHSYRLSAESFADKEAPLELTHSVVETASTALQWHLLLQSNTVTIFRLVPRGNLLNTCLSSFLIKSNQKSI